MICRQCKKCGKCGKPYSSISTHAEICKDFEKKKPTNFEAIKNMSIEEMAKIIMCPFEGDIDIAIRDCSSITCNDCCKQWLESEVEE